MLEGNGSVYRSARFLLFLVAAYEISCSSGGKEANISEAIYYWGRSRPVIDTVRGKHTSVNSARSSASLAFISGVVEVAYSEDPAAVLRPALTRFRLPLLLD